MGPGWGDLAQRQNACVFRTTSLQAEGHETPTVQLSGNSWDRGPENDPRTIIKTLGHSQISLTLNTYSHVLPALRADAAAKFDGDPEAVVGSQF